MIVRMPSSHASINTLVYKPAAHDTRSSAVHTLWLTSPIADLRGPLQRTFLEIAACNAGEEVPGCNPRRRLSKSVQGRGSPDEGPVRESVVSKSGLLLSGASPPPDIRYPGHKVGAGR
jgi:hypothetical protein